MVDVEQKEVGKEEAVVERLRWRQEVEKEEEEINRVEGR